MDRGIGVRKVGAGEIVSCPPHLDSTSQDSRGSWNPSDPSAPTLPPIDSVQMSYGPIIAHKQACAFF